MKTQSKIYKVLIWLARFTRIQLFVSLISLPVIAWWGLPFSTLTLIGNLIFAPILSAFLFVCSLLFFTELLHIPNGLLTWLADNMAIYWLKIINLADSRWMISLPKPPVAWCIIVLATTITIVYHHWFKTLLTSIVAFTFLLVGACAYLKIVHSPKNIIFSIPCLKGKVTIAHTNHQTVVIDPGFLNRTPSPATWIEYTLIPELNKCIGSSTIDHYILMQPSARGFEAVQNLLHITHVKNLYVPYWQGDASPAMLRNWGRMLYEGKKQNTHIIRTGYTSLDIIHTNNHLIRLCALGEWANISTIKLPVFTVKICCDDIISAISSAHAKTTTST